MDENDKKYIEKLGDCFKRYDAWGFPTKVRFTDAEMILKNKIDEIIDKVNSISGVKNNAKD